MKRHTCIFVAALLVIQLHGTGAFAQSCAGEPVAIQILGSGGPTLHPSRASSSYLLWVGNHARVLVDLGGGAYLRFAQAGARLSDLSLLAVTHLDPDHIAGLPALLWLSNRSRPEPLRTVGPSGNDIAPGYATFLYRLFDEKNGAFQIMGSALGGAQAYSQQSVRLHVSAVDAAKKEPSTVYDRAGMTVTALGVPHGEVPTLAYRVQTHGVSIVIGSDQTGTNPAFVRFARGANVLIMHLTIGAGAQNPVHAAPDVVGKLAAEARVGRLIVSHIGPIDLQAAIAELRKFYSGPLTIGADLQCTQVR